MKSRAKVSEKGRVYITATFNNTIVTITDEVGNTLGWGTSGSVGFKGTRKSTPFAATSAVDQVAKKVMMKNNLRSVDVFIKGPGAGRDAALRALKSAGLSITMIADVTPMPHNGVRPKKKRRV
ncbi:30S ribosomal protein S11 [Candidatus Gottesmanbacteria bacterium RIFCSPHIGHO2_02_FULL_39_14]|uniref:Small ribosomal subunit protein uS11 n=3 Tax=Candidatus Gottesmaniibacteriota TaxID=1752720 RepID=A0A1F5ZUA3_9BACT|nr:MAG: 30S ribosomal protein S11 [Candidatus Gottesmanbacteria bacterium RBG_16_38_7b]OGG15963.1 MAG: 30S ribosomal protein S11 [Candidatus Gottesmanbacteria bacterium RIFCSPHIGHO2_02_FULL_39_14]OGG31107.1 MAG: 30S ribosomal protein S11 [Candidatus Gottesmanbacteria bacterium RIFCSPLOWO2_02_FULL_38_8]